MKVEQQVVPPPPPPADLIVITMTVSEAVSLMHILGAVAGADGYPERSVTDALWNALHGCFPMAQKNVFKPALLRRKQKTATHSSNEPLQTSENDEYE